MSKKLIETLLAEADISINGSNPWDLHIKDDRFYHRVVKDGSLGLGESYMDGWWHCQALDQCIAKMLTAKLENRIRSNVTFALQALKTKWFNMQSRSRAAQVAEMHYNLDNTLYRHMLGRTMAYTCGYFKDTKALDIAQDQKFDLVCRKLNLTSDDHVLELGCGWGGFAAHAATHYGCKVVAVNISQAQVAHAKKEYKDLGITFHLCDWRDKNTYNAKGVLFDKIVSIGMAEHVGYQNYGHWLNLVQAQLKNHGLFLLHTIGRNDSASACEPWTEKYIFPNGMLPSIKQLGQAMENGLVMEDWHNFGAYYDTTLMHWHKNFNDHWVTFKAKYDDTFYRMWTYYLLSCAGMFRARDAQLWQIVLSKNGTPGLYESVR